MLIAYVSIAVIASLLLIVSGLGKLRHHRYIVRTVHDVVGVPLHWFPVLAACELAAATGLLAGIGWPALGAAAAAGMVLYFAGAIAGHTRVGDRKGSGPAVQMLVIAVVALMMRVLSM